LICVNSGVILGKLQKNIIIDEADENILVCGPCRCGKGVNNVIPTLKVYQHSVFVIDWHGEASRYSIENQKKLGHEIFIISPEDFLVEDLGFSSFNPLDEIRKESEISDAKMIAGTLLSHIYSLEDIQNSFLKNTTEQLLASLILT
jgi:type IV secretory pathway TraG/TraD family ATPase VirD4